MPDLLELVYHMAFGQLLEPFFSDMKTQLDMKTHEHESSKKLQEDTSALFASMCFHSLQNNHQSLVLFLH